MDRSRAGRTAPLSTEHIDSELSLSRLTVRELRKQYDAVQAVNGVSFEVRAGEIFGLLGPNGAGKTTTVESIAGLIEPDTGWIDICGIDARALPRAAKQKLGVALQTTGWQDGITPREALRTLGVLFEKTVSVAAQLARFGLDAKADARVSTLSGGQKQRLALASALVNDPELIVLDEPTVGLDAQIRREFHAFIRGMRDEGRSILLTTHDMDEAAQLCDRIAVINSGKIVATGTPDDLIAMLRSATRIELISDKPIDAAWLEPATLFRDVRCAGAEVSFTTLDATAALVRLMEVLAANGLQVTRLTAGKGTLEDAILDIIAAQGRDRT